MVILQQLRSVDVSELTDIHFLVLNSKDLFSLLFPREKCPEPIVFCCIVCFHFQFLSECLGSAECVVAWNCEDLECSFWDNWPPGIYTASYLLPYFVQVQFKNPHKIMMQFQILFLEAPGSLDTGKLEEIQHVAGD